MMRDRCRYAPLSHGAPLRLLAHASAAHQELGGVLPPARGAHGQAQGRDGDRSQAKTDGTLLFYDPQDHYRECAHGAEAIASTVAPWPRL